VRVSDTPQGPLELDETGNAIHNVHIKKVERVGGELQNTVIHTYPRVSQFWTYNKEDYLRQPAYDRNYPLCRFCQ
jgi:branched-chain amino acid transport system substrate-binding protein